MPREIVCYHALLLKKWTKRLKKPPTRNPRQEEGMEEVEKRPQGGPGKCTCEPESHHRDREDL